MQFLFTAISSKQKLPKGYAERMFRLVPKSIRALPCFLDRQTGLWRYEYGDPIKTSTGSEIIGTHMFHNVERLFEVICCASWRLPQATLNTYLSRLDDRQHHASVLIEFAPILRLDAAIKIDHECRGFGDGSQTVDWRIQAPDQPVLLLEVKNRIRDLVESFELMESEFFHELNPEPQHDPSMLFKSVINKFQKRQTTDAIQAVWIKTELKQEANELLAAFDVLDSERLHIAVLGSWNAEGYVLGYDMDAKRRVQKILRIENSSRFVFKRSVR